MKSPYDVIIETVRDNLPRSFENSKNNFSSLDKFITWIVGYSTGATVLIISNFKDLDTVFPYYLLKTILLLLCISVGSGIAFRYVLYLLQSLNQNIENYLIGAFSNEDVMGVDVDSLRNETDIKKMINALKVDFDLDYTFVLQGWASLPETEKQLIIEDVKNRHAGMADYTKKSLQLGIETVRDNFKQAYGFSEKEIEKLFTPNNTGKLKTFRRAVNYLFWISSGSFLIVLILFFIFF